MVSEVHSVANPFLFYLWLHTCFRSTSLLGFAHLLNYVIIADVSHYLRSKSIFFADIALFYHVPCASCIVHQKASAKKNLTIFIFRLHPFVYFCQLKKQDMTSSNYGIMGNEDLPPSSGLSCILI